MSDYDIDREQRDATETREKLTLAISYDDKVKLKYVVAKRRMTVAKLVHEWIQTLE